LDTSFLLSADDYAYCLAAQPDGKILVAGSFQSIGGQFRSRIARVICDSPATQSLTYDGTNITWLRYGGSPMVWRTSFDTSTNGTDWVSLGAGVHIPNGWQPASVTLPPNSTIRARGFVTGGKNNGSGWFVETTRPAIQVDGFHPGPFSFKIIGSSSQVVALECSTNLVDWATLSTITLTNGSSYFSDPQWRNYPARFYRLRWP
jgi:Domain of unknown function (DUF5122) beta-propeller